MIIRKNCFSFDVDTEATLQYSREHSLCECSYCRNFYVQARESFPELSAFLAQFGLEIDRPDEIASFVIEDSVEYPYVSYTVIGDILEADKLEFTVMDKGRSVGILVDRDYVPNEQKTNRYFVLSVLNLKMPWILDEPLI